MKYANDKISSSAIKTLAYESDFGLLEVTFHHGNSYTYFGLSPEVYTTMTDGRSVGEFYNAEIKGQYPVYEGPIENLEKYLRPFFTKAVKSQGVAPSPIITGAMQQEMARLNQRLSVVDAIRKIGDKDATLTKTLWELYDYLAGQLHG